MHINNNPKFIVNIYHWTNVGSWNYILWWSITRGYRSQYFICLSLFQYLWFYFINIYVYKYRCNEVPSVFQNIFLSLGTVTDNCVAISFILLPLTKRISQWYQFHSDVEDNSSCNDDYQLDYQVILHTTIYLLYVPQQRV